jgi:hypothetical protein
MLAKAIGLLFGGIPNNDLVVFVKYSRWMWVRHVLAKYSN